MPPVDEATLIPLLQQLVTALTALAQALQGQAGLTAPGTSPSTMAGGAMGAPTAAAATGEAHARHGRKSKGGKPGGKSGGHMGHGMSMVQRTSPVDRGAADTLRNAVRDFFGKVPRSAVQLGGEGNNHGRLPDHLRREFARLHPGMPVPTGVVYPKQGGTAPVGVVYNQPQPANLPMGNGHRHAGSKNTMQHIWFVGNLDRAYSDLSQGGAQTMFRTMQREGRA